MKVNVKSLGGNIVRSLIKDQLSGDYYIIRSSSALLILSVYV